MDQDEMRRVDELLYELGDTRLQASWMGLRGAANYADAIRSIEGNELHAEMVDAMIELGEDLMNMAILGKAVADAVAQGRDPADAVAAFYTFEVDPELVAAAKTAGLLLCGAEKHGYRCGLPRDHDDPTLHAAMTDSGLMASWREGTIGVRLRRPPDLPVDYVEMTCGEGHRMRVYQSGELLKADTPDGRPCPQCITKAKEAQE